MIQINHVSKSFGSFKALDDVSIHVKPGTIHGLIGENGAGKTTLIQCLVGIYTQDQGEILIDGEPIWENDDLKAQIGYVADRNQFFKGYRIEELVDFFELMYPNFSREDFERYNRTFGLKMKAKTRQLSKGMQMRLSFMLYLATHPKVMVLDEPTSGLDAIAKKQLLDFLIEEVEEKGMTVVISSHHLGELEKLCDEMTMIQNGKVTYASSVDELKDQVRKIQVVFEEEAPADLRQWPELLSVEQIGHVYYLITSHYSEQMIERLKQRGAIKLATLGLTLEEIFIYANQKMEVYDEQA